jgi:tRNA dimethylallyltransferase
MSGIGYRQVGEYLAGVTTLKSMSERIKQATHRYARHQMTWLRRDASVLWLDAADADALQRAATEAVTRFLL